MTLTDDLLSPILAADPATPRITYYDDSTGERVELSGVTLTNWAAKTANFLRDEFMLSPGDRVSVALPAHWQTAAVLLGAWWAGCEVVLGADDDADVTFVTSELADSVTASGELVVLSLDPFGRAADVLPAGATDYATSVRVHGDQFRSYESSAGPVFAGLTKDDVLTRAKLVCADHEWSSGDRVLSALSWSDADSTITGFVAILAAGASLVQVRNIDAAVLDRRIETEKVTRTLGVS